MNLFKYLHKPHPFIFNAFSVLIPGLVTFLIIAITAPFGFSELDNSQRLLFALLFGGIGSITVLIAIPLLRWLFPRFMNEEQWTTGREISLILIVIACICLVNVGVIQLLELTSLPFPELLQKVVLYTVLLSILPVGIMVLAEQYSHQHKKLNQALQLTESLRRKSNSPDPKSSPSDIIALEGENGKTELQLRPEELLFLKSDGNYVEVFFLDDSDNTQKRLLRNRLKALHQQLPADRFFQCHKSYVVNLHQILKVEGNARSLELTLRGYDHSIPVSRSKSMKLQALISA